MRGVDKLKSDAATVATNKTAAETAKSNEILKSGAVQSLGPNATVQSTQAAQVKPTPTTGTTTSQVKPTPTTGTTTPAATQTTTTALSTEQEKNYQQAKSNMNNPLAQGMIKSEYNKLSPEQQAAFRERAKQDGIELPF